MIGSLMGYHCIEAKLLTHWGRLTHICVSKLTIIGSDNGLSPGRHQAIIWTNAGILLIWPLGKNFSEILINIHTFSFKKIHFQMSSGKWRQFCLGLNVLTHWPQGDVVSPWICHFQTHTKELSWTFPMKLPSGEHHMTSLMIRQHWFR